MAGYDGFSMSNNAVAAYAAGKAPISVATKKVAELAGVSQKIARQALKATGPCEWHHSSKFYNRTNFYDIAEAVKWCALQPLIARLNVEQPSWQDEIGSGCSGGKRAGQRDQIAAEIAARIGVTPDQVLSAYYCPEAQ